MERRIPLSSNYRDTPNVNDERELRQLAQSVRRAYLGGELMSRHENPDKSVGGWVSEEVVLGDEVQIGATAVVLGSKVLGRRSIGSRVSIWNGAVVRNSDIRDNTSIGEGATVKNSLLLGNNDICDGAEIESAIIGQDVSVGKRAFVKKSEVRNRVRICAGAKVRDSKLLGDNEIGDGSVISDSVVFSRMEIGQCSVIEHSRIELTKARRVPPNSSIIGDIVHSDLDVVHVESNIIDPPEDLLPVRDYQIDKMLDEALETKRK